jgi:hypothetical protein
MLRQGDLRTYVIQPACNAIKKWSPNAEELLVATFAHESLGGTFLAQQKGPARGGYQHEPDTYADDWRVAIDTNNFLKSNILTACQYACDPGFNTVTYNIFYATIMARVHFSRFPESIPDKNDIVAIYNYYKKYWNSSAGAANQSDFIAHYTNYIK